MPAAVQIVGGLLPPDLLTRLVEARDVPGLASADFHLAGSESVREAAARSWTYLRGAWQSFRDAVEPLVDAGAPTTSLTRERWLLLVLRELGYGRVSTAPTGGIVVDDRAFPVSHLWEPLQIHLLGWGSALDTRTKGRAGAATRAPQAMVQELLNRSDAHLWAMLSNGQVLRLLRDSAALVGPAYVEFDLEAIFDGELFSDFVLLWLLCHQSRVEPLGDGSAPECWLERWRAMAIATDSRALTELRAGVADALRTLGTGFVSHPANGTLRAALADGRYDATDVNRALLRLIYRLLFWFVAEDRGVLVAPGADRVAVARCDRYFSSTRLRQLSARRRGSRHPDVWQAVQLVLTGLDTGAPELGLPALGGLFTQTPLDEPLAGLQLSNESLLGALRSLSTLPAPSGGRRRTVDYRNLGAEELGSVYESLLELVPGWDPATGEFRLVVIAGNDREATGAHYTPTRLVECLLDSALNPLLDEAGSAADPEAALLALTVCDPACGSGHFLVAAARRIAKRLAAVRSVEPEPTLPEVQSALWDVIARCIHGVDVNPLAAELAKVSLWLEALEPGRPLTFLDAHIRAGNSLLGTTPTLLAGGLPDATFMPIEGDDRTWASALTRRNRVERDRSAQGELIGTAGLRVANTWFGREVAAIDALRPDSLADVAEQQRRQAALEADPDRRRAVEVADAWCAAFVWRKTADAPDAITHRVLVDLDRNPNALPTAVRKEVARLAAQHRFFHWHLEFPHIFAVPAVPGRDTDPETGWTGGFSCVLGNPSWARVKLQERDFFAARDERIATAPNAAARHRLIADLAVENADLFAAFGAAKRRAEGESHLLRSTGRFPLTGRGDINTYAVFAETDRMLLSPHGRLGVVMPTGIATDATTQYFFRDLVESSSLASLYDFENRQPLFKGVDSRTKFCLLTLTGRAVREAAADFAFFLHDPAELAQPDARFRLKPDEITLLNPNTGTCPVFRSRRDAEITLGIYRRVPVLIREGDPDGNPWGLSFMTMFHMSNDSHLFHTRDQLEADGWRLHGNVFTRGNERMLPLYEAKMLHHYDHRWATYDAAGATRDITPTEKRNPHIVALPRYWVAAAEVEQRLKGRWNKPWLLGWRDICRSTDERTLISGSFPVAAVGHTSPLVVSSHGLQLQACWSSLVLDYVVRQKVGGTHLTYGYVQQLPVPVPNGNNASQGSATALPTVSINSALLELTYTNWDMEPFARDLGDSGPPFRWDNERRALLRAELDAAYFHLYGVERDDVDYILETFPIVKRKDIARFGEYRTKRLILDIYDAMTTAIDTGVPYQTVIVPPPGQGPRHPARTPSTEASIDEGTGGVVPASRTGREAVPGTALSAHLLLAGNPAQPAVAGHPRSGGSAGRQ